MPGFDIAKISPRFCLPWRDYIVKFIMSSLQRPT
jgi:hypothetical protein